MGRIRSFPFPRGCGSSDSQGPWITVRFLPPFLSPLFLGIHLFHLFFPLLRNPLHSFFFDRFSKESRPASPSPRSGFQASRRKGDFPLAIRSENCFPLSSARTLFTSPNGAAIILAFFSSYVFSFDRRLLLFPLLTPPRGNDHRFETQSFPLL